MRIERENKLVIRNDYAVVVLKDGITSTVKVMRPVDPVKDNLSAPRDMEFRDFLRFEEFVIGCREVYLAACKEMVIDPAQGVFEEVK